MMACGRLGFDPVGGGGANGDAGGDTVDDGLVDPPVGHVLHAAGGRLHTCAIRSDGTMWCWGGNSNGETGIGVSVALPAPTQVTALTSPATAVASSGGGGSVVHTCAILADRTLWCWGSNVSG